MCLWGILTWAFLGDSGLPTCKFCLIWGWKPAFQVLLCGGRALWAYSWDTKVPTCKTWPTWSWASKGKALQAFPEKKKGWGPLNAWKEDFSLLTLTSSDNYFYGVLSSLGKDLQELAEIWELSCLLQLIPLYGIIFSNRRTITRRPGHTNAIRRFLSFTDLVHCMLVLRHELGKAPKGNNKYIPVRNPDPDDLSVSLFDLFQILKRVIILLVVAITKILRTCQQKPN